MATENLDGIYSFPAAADYRNAQYQAVVINTSGQAALAGLGVRPHGILHNAPNVGEQARVILMAGVVVKLRLGTGGATLGALLSTDANGKGVISVTSTHKRFAIANAAGVAGEIIEALYVPGLADVP